MTRGPLIAALAVAFPLVAWSQGDGRLTMPPDAVRWPAAAGGGTGTSGAAGIQTVVLKGDPAKAGLYTLMLRIPANTRIQAHRHPDDRVATVIRGTWHFGYGDVFNEARLTALPPGSVYTEPPNVNHFAMAREEVVVQITGTGPSGTTYVDPAQDPARR
jgi:quercetin dioxygenase-like cupin family protein